MERQKAITTKPWWTKKRGVEVSGLTNATFGNILEETNQGHTLRRPILERIQELRRGRAVVSFFISFGAHIPLSQKDADMLEEVLANIDCSQGLTLILDAPGGDGLAAERIIQACRAYSGEDFEAIIPARAKSAATMICLGADRVIMSPTSELGPIDPQVVYDLGQGPVWVAAHHITRTYEDLLASASQPNANIAPYLQQLDRFNAVNISWLREAAELSEEIAVRSLANGMLKGEDEETIRERIKPFTDPTIMKSHGRGITADTARECGLEVEMIDLSSDLWKTVRSLYLRSNHVVDNPATTVRKLLETVNDSYLA